MSERSFREDVRYYFRVWTDYAFRHRLPGLALVRFSVLIFLALLTGWGSSLSIPTSAGLITFGFTTDGVTPNWLYIAAIGVVALLLAVGLFLLLRELDRRRVIVIELRGLRDIAGRPLADAVPRKLVGRRDQLLLDVRQGQDGNISEPRAMLTRVQSLPNELSMRQAGLNRSDFTYVLGGLAPVPFTFLVGVLTDDEESVTVMDWNRHMGNWCELDAPDDGKRFMVTGLDAIPMPNAEVVLAVSVSYAVDREGVAQKLPNVPLVEMILEGGGPDAHWSESKQMELGRQFLQTLIALGNKGVRTIHLFLAAPSSIVLRFGRLYDKRNLPALIVYQYERRESPPYPWAIRMPVEGSVDAELMAVTNRNTVPSRAL